MYSIKKILIVFIVWGGAQLFAGDLHLEAEEVYLEEKIDALIVTLKKESSDLEYRERKIQLALKLGKEFVTLAPYLILYYKGIVPESVVDYMLYSMPPFSSYLFRKTIANYAKKSEELESTIKHDISELMTLLPQLKTVLAYAEKLKNVDEHNFLEYLGTFESSEDAVEKLFVDIKSAVTKKNQGKKEVNFINDCVLLRKLIVLFILMQEFQEWDTECTAITKCQPTLYLSIISIWHLSFHSYETFVQLIANKFRPFAQNIRNQKIPPHAQALYELIIKVHTQENELKKRHDESGKIDNSEPKEDTQ